MHDFIFLSISVLLSDKSFIYELILHSADLIFYDGIKKVKEINKLTKSQFQKAEIVFHHL